MIDYVSWMQNYVIENKIFDFRCQKGLSRKQFGEIVGLSEKTISALERGSVVPTVTFAYFLVSFFEVPFDKLFILRRKQ